MKNILSISLLSIFLFSAVLPITIWSDIAKISNLIEHYQTHKQEDSNTSFWAFIDLHYGKDAQKHATAHDHSKLPLKNATPSVYAYILMSAIENHSFHISSFLWNTHENRQGLPNFSQNFTSFNLTDIWQPPRVS